VIGLEPHVWQKAQIEFNAVEVSHHFAEFPDLGQFRWTWTPGDGDPRGHP
jgi:hypothetical protein